MKKTLLILLTAFSTIGYTQANEASTFTELATLSKDPLVKAAYEVGLLSSLARSFPTTAEHSLSDLVENMSAEEVKNKIQKITTLFNLVCGQNYVAHLKELKTLNTGEITKKDLNLHNYYNQYDITASPSPLTNAWTCGALESTKLLAKENFSEIAKVCQYCLADLDSYLPKEFEKSYREIFNLETSNKTFQHPYYDAFCGKAQEPTNSKVEL